MIRDIRYDMHALDAQDNPEPSCQTGNEPSGNWGFYWHLNMARLTGLLCADRHISAVTQFKYTLP